MKKTLAFLLIAASAAACGDAETPSMPGGEPSGPKAGGTPGLDGGRSTTNPGPSNGSVDGPGPGTGTNPGTGSPDSGTPQPGTPDSGTTPTTPSPSFPVASGVTISEIAVYQAVKVSLVKNGARVQTLNAPIVAKRSALVRVSVARGTGYAGQPITAELRLDGAVYKDTKVAPTAAADATLASTFNFEVPGEAIQVATKFSVALTDQAAPAGSTGSAGARYPSSGTPETLGAQSAGDQLKVVLVPIRYDADGSNRLPDISAAQVELYRSTIYALYPAAKVDVTVHAPYPFTSTISAGGNGFSAALQAMVRLRAQEKPTRDVYYYGIFSPTTSFSTYCRGGCVLGLSGLGQSPSDANVRASVGIGFPGNQSTTTAAHEIGHAHGREHVDCGNPAGADPDYPYPGGQVGVWGYNLSKKTLVNPTQGKDFMSYCTPEWISDYQFKKLFDRVKFVNGAAVQSFSAETLAYRMLDVAADGALTWRDTVQLDSPPSAEPREVTYVDGSDHEVAKVTGQFYRYDHLPGGFMLVPETTRTFAKVHVAGFGDTQ